MDKKQYLSYCLDVLSPIVEVTYRAMFGGYGLYVDGVIFAIIADATLYFKVDDRSRLDYERLGSEPFSYTTKRGQFALKTYWRVPEEVLEDSDMLSEWVETALIASKT